MQHRAARNPAAPSWGNARHARRRWRTFFAMPDWAFAFGTSRPPIGASDTDQAEREMNTLPACLSAPSAAQSAHGVRSASDGRDAVAADRAPGARAAGESVF